MLEHRYMLRVNEYKGVLCKMEYMHDKRSREKVRNEVKLSASCERIRL